MGSTSDKASGKAKKTAGKVTGNKKMQAEGDAEKARGEVKKKVNNAVDAVSDKMDRRKS